MLDGGKMVEIGLIKQFFDNPQNERTRTFLKRVLNR